MTEDLQRTVLLAVTLLAAVPLACRDAPRGREPAPPDTAPSASASLPPARYVTVLAWTAGGGSPAGVLWMENWTGASGDLVRRYRGWRVDGASVRPVLRVSDTLPVAAAAWRPLPAPGLRLSVDPRGRLSSLNVGPGEVRLRLDRELASWRGATGSEQRLRRGRLLAASGETATAEITAAVLRFEQLPGDPGPVGPARTLLLAGEDGSGLLVLDEGTDRPWSRGWSWDDQGSTTQLDAASLPDGSPGEVPWTFPGPDRGGVRAEWRVSGADSLAAARADSPGSFHLVPATARVREGRGARPARGYLLLAP